MLKKLVHPVWGLRGGGLVPLGGSWFSGPQIVLPSSRHRSLGPCSLGTPAPGDKLPPEVSTAGKSRPRGHRPPTPVRAISGHASAAAPFPCQHRSMERSPSRRSTRAVPVRPSPQQQPSDDPTLLHVAPWCEGKISPGGWRHTYVLPRQLLRPPNPGCPGGQVGLMETRARTQL